MGGSLQDLIEADGAHFLGTIITLNDTMDAVEGGVLELIDGQQRMTTLTLLLAAVYSTLKQHYDELDEDTRTDVTNLGRQLVRKANGEPRVTPQIQGHNLDDYRTVLADAGLKIEFSKKPYFPMRRIAKCFNYFRSAINKLAESDGLDAVKAALRRRSGRRTEFADRALKDLVCLDIRPLHHISGILPPYLVNTLRSCLEV